MFQSFAQSRQQSTESGRVPCARFWGTPWRRLASMAETLARWLGSTRRSGQLCQIPPALFPWRGRVDAAGSRIHRDAF